MSQLTENQRKVLRVVQQHTARNGYPPTVREIGRELGLSSPSSVHAHLATLEKLGILQRDPSKPRAITLDPTGSVAGPDGQADVDGARMLPVLGQVAAGEPLLAEERVEEYLPVPRMLTRAGDGFLLKVRGDSMIEAGILDGDYVVVRAQRTANNGQIVVVLLDGEATCKHWHRRGDRVELRPANVSMQPIVASVDRDLELVGIVTGVMRAY